MTDANRIRSAMGLRLERLVKSYRSARVRAQRRKSPWNLVLIPLGLAAVSATWYGLFRLVWAVHVLAYPAHALVDFWPDGITAPSFLLSFLMVFGPAPGALAVGMLLSNGVAWLIGPARHAFEAEASDHPRTTFRNAMRGLWRLAVWVLPAGLVVAIIAAIALSSLR